MIARREQRVFVTIFLAPAFFLFTLFVAWPGLRALVYSLQKWDGLSRPEWAGLDNFRKLFADDLFLVALGHNLFLTATAGSLTIVLALFFASLLHRRIRGAALFRIVFFFPNVISSVAIALLWILLYSATSFGAINGLLFQVQRLLVWADIGWLDDVLPIAFADSGTLIYAIVPMMVWMATGFYMVLFLAAMEGIPETYYEAATLDGASPLAQFRYITLPLIREVLVLGIVFLVISGAKFFDAIWVMESQVPSKDSHVMATVLYQKVFTEYNIGYAAAVAVMLFVLVFFATLVTLNLSRKEALEF